MLDSLSEAQVKLLKRHCRRWRGRTADFQWFIPREKGLRFAIVVSKKQSLLAVERNLAKRRWREVLRKNLDRRSAYWIMLYLKKLAAYAEYQKDFQGFRQNLTANPARSYSCLSKNRFSRPRTAR